MDDHDEQISDDMPMVESNQEIEFECIFCVGSFFIDLSEFHNFGEVENYVAQGWISFDALIQAPIYSPLKISKKFDSATVRGVLTP